MSCVEQGFTFKSPLSILVVGPSNCGKTTFLKRLFLENEDLLVRPPRRIIYCYGSWQPTFDILKRKGVTFHKGSTYPGGDPGINHLDRLAKQHDIDSQS